MARYAGLLLAPAESFARGFFCPLGKKRAWYAVLPILGHFWCSVVTLITFSINLSNLRNKINPTIQKKKYVFKSIKKKLKISKIVQKSKNFNKSQKSLLLKKLKNFEKKIFFFAGKKCYSLSFANWGDKSVTRAHQFSPFQNPGGVPWAWRSTSYYCTTVVAGRYFPFLI